MPAQKLFGVVWTHVALKSLAIRAIWLTLSSVIYSQIAPFFALNRIFLPANEKGTLKQHNQRQRAFNFEITRMISDQIALHSVELPLLITSLE